MYATVSVYIFSLISKDNIYFYTYIAPVMNSIRSNSSLFIQK